MSFQRKTAAKRRHDQTIKQTDDISQDLHFMRPKKLHMKNGGVNFRDTSPWVFFTLLILHKWYQIITSNLNKKNTNLKQLTKNLQWEFIVTWSCIFVIIEKNQVLFLTCSALNLRIFLTSFEQVVSLQN